MEEPSKKQKKPLDLDSVLVNELGQFGWFQLRNILLVALPVIMSAASSEYIFSAATVPYRCRISECGEDGKFHNFTPNWITNAIPETGLGLAECRRYAPSGIENGTLDHCPAEVFVQSVTVECDGFVYAKNNSVVYEFDLGCQDWLRALAGTLNSVGTLISLPVTGYISDRFGRRAALVVNVFNLGLFGLMRAFSVNYTMYAALHILQTISCGGIFSSAYIFTTELVGPRYRVLAGIITASMFSVGQILLGTVAWLIQPWRSMIMALHVPCFLIISYYWILSESIRWLLSKKKYAQARGILENIARVNKTTISENSMEALMNPVNMFQESQLEKPNVIKAIIRSPILLRRVCTTPIWWVTTVFIYYGLSINSTSLSDTMYLNFIVTCAIEIPGFFLALGVLDRIGRRATLSAGFFINATCNVAFIFIPKDLTVPRLVVFLLGKFAISTVVTSLYLYTSELYPTQYRHTLLGFSSMIGRIGSITAPLTPVLANYWHGIPSMTFGVMAAISGLLVLTQPETLGTKMPDTLAEAEALDRPELKKPS